MSGWNQAIGVTDPRLIPDKVIRMMSPEDRKRYGKHCRTQEERQASITVKSEKQLQENIASLLRQRGTEFNVSRMDRATTGKVGWPDFCFAINGQAVAIECKMPGQEPTEEQVKCMMGLIRDGWFVRVVTSEDQFLQAIKDAENLNL